MSAPLIRLAEPPRRTAPGGFALWQLGFRPFYLLASSFAALSIGLWALQFARLLGGAVYLQGPLWHAHEMLFGFALAVVVGFLLTAGRNWTGQPTPTGAPLAALAALWLAGRVLVVTPFGIAAALVNVAFPVAAAIALAIPFYAARNQRNYFFVALLLMMAGAEACVHLSQLGWLQLPGWLGIQLALDILLFIMAVMAGRVLPMFTNNGVPGAGAVKDERVEKIALGSVLALLAVDALPLPAAVVAAVAGFAAAAHLLRWALWRPWKTGGQCAGLGAAPGLLLGARPPGSARAGAVRHRRAIARHTCVDRRRGRRPDHRHDDAHRARPHRPPAARRAS